MTRNMIDKIHYLKQYDVHFLIFGASKHRYECGDVLSEQGILKFEKKYGVRLPEDYRIFIQTIGNGGVGPGYGLFPLGESDRPYDYKYLNHPFQFETDFVMEDQEDEFECRYNDCGKCEYSTKCYVSEYIEGEYIDGSRYQQGSMAICFEGCSYYRRLIMNGPHYGEIWAESEGEGLKRTKTSFVEWYTAWLDKSIACIEPYVQAVSERKSFDELLLIPGEGLFHFEEHKAEFVAGLLHLNVPLPERSKMDKERYVSDIKAEYNLQCKKCPLTSETN